MVKPMRIEEIIGCLGGEFHDEAVDKLIDRVRGRLDKALKGIRRPEAAVGVVKSPLGDLLIATSVRGVALNHYVRHGDDLATGIAKLRLAFDPIEDDSSVRTIGEEIRGYLAGNASALRQNVDLTLAVNPFQQNVLRELSAVPRGAVTSYQALGASVGVPKGARAVGNALHNNPVAIYVPCHRVISADGRIGGYAGGASRKLLLLRSEGFAVDSVRARIPSNVVWGHKRTMIYCRPDCRTAARVDRTRILFFADPKEAQRANMRACKICRPGAD
jgi:methylated-DNA-[protein]-cysteine S-methyltransferase